MAGHLAGCATTFLNLYGLPPARVTLYTCFHAWLPGSFSTQAPRHTALHSSTSSTAVPAMSPAGTEGISCSPTVPHTWHHTCHTLHYLLSESTCLTPPVPHYGTVGLRPACLTPACLPRPPLLPEHRTFTHLYRDHLPQFSTPHTTLTHYLPAQPLPLAYTSACLAHHAPHCPSHTSPLTLPVSLVGLLPPPAPLNTHRSTRRVSSQQDRTFTAALPLHWLHSGWISGRFWRYLVLCSFYCSWVYSSTWSGPYWMDSSGFLDVVHSATYSSAACLLPVLVATAISHTTLPAAPPTFSHHGLPPYTLPPAIPALRSYRHRGR